MSVAAPDGAGDRHGGVTATPGLTRVESVSRRDGAIREIRRAIVVGHLQPGEKLTESRLVSSLNVSRPTLREALAQLVQEGLLIQEPYRSLRVAELDPAAIMNLARTRMALDLLAAEDILADPTGRRLEAVGAAWREFDRLPFDADPADAHAAHITFHRQIWAASENRVLIRVWPVTEAHLILALAQDRVVHDDPRRNHDMHEQIVEALSSRDLARVRDALAVHTLGSAEELVASGHVSA